MLPLPILSCQATLLTVILYSDMTSRIGRYRRVFGFHEGFFLFALSLSSKQEAQMLKSLHGHMVSVWQQKYLRKQGSFDNLLDWTREKFHLFSL